MAETIETLFVGQASFFQINKCKNLTIRLFLILSHEWPNKKEIEQMPRAFRGCHLAQNYLSSKMPRKM
jgi:hypothetical protein